MERNYTVTTLPYRINEPFLIRQIVVQNLTPNPIYLNYSSSFPTNLKYDLIVNPQSVYTSSAISTNVISLLQDGFVPNGSILITTLDAAIFTPSTSFGIQDAFTIMPGYPTTVDMGVNGNNLPQFPINKVGNYYFICERYGTLESTSFGITLMNPANQLDFNYHWIGGVSGYGGIIPFNPFKISQGSSVYNFAAWGIHDSFGTNMQLTAVYSPYLLEMTPHIQQHQFGQIANGASKTANFFIRPPGYVWSLAILPAFAGTYNIDIVQNFGLEVRSFTLSGQCVNGVWTEVKTPTIEPVSFIRSASIVITNNSGNTLTDCMIGINDV